MGKGERETGIIFIERKCSIKLLICHIAHHILFYYFSLNLFGTGPVLDNH